jgi:hypothetical protein
MIDMSDRPYVHVRLAAIKFFLRHDFFSVSSIQPGASRRLKLISNSCA